jgi:hypothetical protein
MGRPLSKKYFGNRNVGSASTTADDGLGGQGVASVTITAAGNYAAGGSIPTVTFSAPDLAGAGAVTAAGTVAYRARTLTAAPSGTQTIAYQVGQVLTMSISGTAYGTTATVATISASASDTIASVNGSNQVVFSNTTAYLPGMDFLTNAGITFNSGGLSAGTRYWIVAGSGTTYTVANSYANALAGHALTLTAGNVTSNGAVLVGTTAGPIATVSTTPTTKGLYTLGTIPNAYQDTTTVGGGAGATIKVATFEVDSVTITESGSGYSSPTDAAATFSAGTSTATGASVLTTNDGEVGVVGHNEPAIIITAYLPTSGTAGYISGSGGSSAKESDIVRQTGTNKYECKNADGLGIVQLVGLASGSLAAGQANIIATDSDTNTYYVTKLTAHKATVVPATGTQFVSGQVVNWSFDSATANVSVQVQSI